MIYNREYNHCYFKLRTSLRYYKYCSLIKKIYESNTVVLNVFVFICIASMIDDDI